MVRSHKVIKLECELETFSSTPRRHKKSLGVGQPLGKISKTAEKTTKNTSKNFFAPKTRSRKMSPTTTIADKEFLLYENLFLPRNANRMAHANAVFQISYTQNQLEQLVVVNRLSKNFKIA